MLDIRDAEGVTPTTLEIDELVESGAIAETLSELGEVHEVGLFSFEQRRGYWGELSTTVERTGIRMYERAMMYQLFIRGKAVGVMCATVAGEEDHQKADLAMSLIKPVCQ
ncbi:hypothetical protein JYU09_01965 [bacterium AH-315-O15]|nr:hypothetical protein [bacterium AH-315-O15]